MPITNPSGTSLINWTESSVVYSSRYHSKFFPNSEQPDVHVVLQPKGDGSIIAQMPDGTVAGGNYRGMHAVDLQLSRNAATQVATGVSSCIAGGAFNRASGVYSFAVGYLNTASIAYASCCGGSTNTSSGVCTLTGGFNNIASGSYSTAFCSSNTVSGQKSFAVGYYNTVSGTESVAMGTFANVANDKSFVISSGASPGYSQATKQVVRGTINSATTITLTTDGSAASTTNQFIVSNNSTSAFTVLVVARNVTNTAVRDAALIKGCVSRGSNPASTTVTGVAMEVLESSGTITFNVVADTTNGGLSITATSSDSNIVKLTACIDSVTSL